MSCLRSLIVAGLAVPVAVLAQDVKEEIVVTAGLRDAALMTSAGSTTIVSSETVEERAAKHLESVLRVSPNVSFSSGGSRARFVQIRGVGDLEQFVDPKHYPSVGISVDAINLGGTANAAMLFDVEQIEILRGPQGTAFGTTALGGLVNLHGRRPDEEFGGSFELGAGNYGETLLGGSVTGAMSDSLRARFALQHHEGDGYIENRHLGRDDTNGYDETSARAVFELTPSDTAAYTFTALWFDGDNGYDAYSLQNTRDTLSDAPGRDAQETMAVSAEGRWSLAAGELELIGTVLETDLDYAYDPDWAFAGYCDGTFCDPAFDPLLISDRYIRDRSENSLDLRYSGERPLDGGRSLYYVVGTYMQQRDEALQRQFYTDFSSAYNADRTAVYARFDFGLSEHLTLSTGLRHESFDDGYSDSADFASSYDDTLIGGELTLTYTYDSGALWYATVSRGEKAGGINTDASSGFASMSPAFVDFMDSRLRFSTERLINREIGYKHSLVDGRLNLRASLFDMNRDDAQLESWIWDEGGGDAGLWIGFLDNVDADTRGAEIELDFTTDSGLQAFLSIGRLDTRLDAISTFDLDVYDFVVRENIETAKSPDWQYNAGVRVPVGSRLHARVEIEGGGSSRFGYYHDGRVGRYGLVNASLEVAFGSSRLQLWARNLTDEDYAVHALYFGNDPRDGWANHTYRQFGEPRVLGVTLRRDF